MISRRLVTAFILSISANNALAEDVNESSRVPREMQGAEITDKQGTQLDLGLVFTRQDGSSVALADYFGKKTSIPSIVTIGYYECPMLCSLVLNALLDSMNKMSLVLGKDYRVLSFSIDPKESVDLAKAKRQSHLKALSLEDGAWDFFTGDEASIAKLAGELGFGFKYDSRSGDYAHGAGIFIITPEGVLSRTITGLIYEPRDTKFALMEASGGKVGSVFDRIVLTCFHYEPDSHKYGFYVFGAMRIGAGLTVLFLGSMLAWYWFSERRRRMGVA